MIPCPDEARHERLEDAYPHRQERHHEEQPFAVRPDDALSPPPLPGHLLHKRQEVEEGLLVNVDSLKQQVLVSVEGDDMRPPCLMRLGRRNGRCSGLKDPLGPCFNMPQPLFKDVDSIGQAHLFKLPFKYSKIDNSLEK